MTSLEHEHDDLSRGNDSVSDYDYDQLAEQVNWGDMEVNSINYIIKLFLHKLLNNILLHGLHLHILC